MKSKIFFVIGATMICSLNVNANPAQAYSWADVTAKISNAIGLNSSGRAGGIPMRGNKD